MPNQDNAAEHAAEVLRERGRLMVIDHNEADDPSAQWVEVSSNPARPDAERLLEEDMAISHFSETAANSPDGVRFWVHYVEVTLDGLAFL